MEQLPGYVTVRDCIDGLLRGRTVSGAIAKTPSLPILLCVIIVCGCSYGAVMGSYSERPLQIFYSASKMPLLFGCTFLVSLPAFYVLNTLAGLRDDFGRALYALAATQAGLNIILLSFAPITLFWYRSIEDYSTAVALNAVMFGVASVTAQRLLLRFYAPLIAANATHRIMLRVWIIIFAFVGIQMGWVLRPFIGSPSRPPAFLRTGEWSNAYVAVTRLFFKVLFGD